MKIAAFIIVFVVLNNLSFGKTLSYITYGDDIEIDDINNQVVFGHWDAYYITSVNNGRIYLENKYSKRILEYKEDGKFKSFNIYMYGIYNRYEFFRSYKIMSCTESEKEPSIYKAKASIPFIPLRDLIVKEQFGGNWSLFESDSWYLMKISDRINIVCDILLKVLRAESFNKSNIVCYNNYNDMVSNGDTDKLIKLLENRKLSLATSYLNRLALDKRPLYYFDETKNKWIDYFYQ